jgi:FkbM family methyltransferase
MLNSLIDLALKFRGLRVVLAHLKMRTLANLALGKFPRVRTLHGVQIRYRMRTLDSVLVAKELFVDGAYDGIFPLDDIGSFADVGCNCGFFTCFLCNALGRKDLIGLMVDANPEMVRESEWHVETNGLRRVEVVWGVMGAKSSVATEAFYLHPDAAASSRFPQSPEDRVTRNQWRRIEAPVLSLASEWRSRFGEKRCDLLKVDIEGSEESLLDVDANFISAVHYLILEVHSWLVNQAALEEALRKLSFRFVKTLSRRKDTEVRFYVKA